MSSGEYKGSVKQADDSNLYLELLIFRLKDLTELYSALLSRYAKVVMDEDLFNTFIAELIVTGLHVYYKLVGTGDRGQFLVNEYKEFEKWFDNITLPKTNIEEQKKVHKFYRLVLRSYDFLGLSRY